MCYIILSKCNKKLRIKYFTHPYYVGANKRSQAIVLPSQLVKLLEINPLDTYVLLSQYGSKELHLEVIKVERLTNKYVKKSVSSENLPASSPRTPSDTMESDSR